MKVFNSDFYIAAHMADCRQRLKPVAFMQMAQEMAMQGADGLGFGYDDLIARDAAWVLSRMHIQFGELPRWKETVNVRTWHKGASGPFFLRDFILGDGAVKATSSWVVMNMTERKMVRFDALGDLIPASGESTEHVIETPAPKVTIPRTATLLQECTHVVSWSDVDLNRHANNTRYVEWAMDTLDYGFLEAHALRDLHINYHHETRPGSLLTLRTFAPAEDGELTRFVEILDDGRTAFTCKLIFDKAL